MDLLLYFDQAFALICSILIFQTKNKLLQISIDIFEDIHHPLRTNMKLFGEDYPVYA